MPSPTPNPPVPTSPVARIARTSLLIAVVTLLIAVGCLVVGVTLGVRTVTEDAAERVTVTVTAVGSHRERRGSRRSRHRVDVRHVEVTAADGRSGRLDSEDLEVGDTAEVWRTKDDGALSVDDPSGIDVADGVVVGALAAASLLFGTIATGSFRRAGRLRRTDVANAPRIVLALDRATLDAEPHRTREGGALNLPLRVVESDDPRTPVGRTENLTISPQVDPVDLSSGIPTTWEGRVLHRGALMRVVALRTRPDAPWWVTDL
ncbi:hypothetical protein FHP29_20795 [Nocardioides albidus]|uniref:Uncharacterized protein n=1 Tax=Nocardioides albidus TaxID=1517589 RepID=A0A5C4VLB6_9ACTN|nr:hypothetical protein [Nocardioides albidus]TNM36567.1 hypothetical protein FHP29_20795 [Nocardioides albidus]